MTIEASKSYRSYSFFSRIVTSFGILWFIATLVRFGFVSLSAQEGSLLGQWESQGLHSNSILFNGILWALSGLGSPVESIIRCLGLISLPIGIFAFMKILGQPKENTAKTSERLVSLALIFHGSMIVTSFAISPAQLTWVAQSALILVVFSLPSQTKLRWKRLVSVALTSFIAVAADPFNFILACALILWFRFEKRAISEQIALFLPALLTFGLSLAFGYVSLTGISLPDFGTISQNIAGWPSIYELDESAHLLIQYASPSIAIALVILATYGFFRAPLGAKMICAGLILTSFTTAILRQPDEQKMIGAWLFPPLCILAAFHLRHSKFLSLPVLFLIGVSLFSGLRVLIWAEPAQTRDIASALEPCDEIAIEDQGLRRAVEIYREKNGPCERRQKFHLYTRGDREPRKIYVVALGRPFGRHWLLKRSKVTYDLGANLTKAHAIYRERGKTYAYRWQKDPGRFITDGPDYQQIAWSYSDFFGVEQSALLVHPLDDGKVEITWNDIPLGGKLVGIAGLDDKSMEYSEVPVRIEVKVTGQKTLKLERGDQRGLIPFEISTKRASEQGSVTVTFETPDDRGRQVFFDALTLP